MKRQPPDVLDSLLASGEGARVEFKRRLPAERRLARLLASLANAGGGSVLVGVEDDGTVCGVSEPAAVAHEVAALAALLLDPVPPLEQSFVSRGGREVLIVRVAPAVRTVYLAFEDTPAYVRVNDRNLPAGSVLKEAGRTREVRLQALGGAVRRRFENVVKKERRFTPKEYAKTCNISGRQARRDIVSLERAFLVVEVERGLLEALDE